MSYDWHDIRIFEDFRNDNEVLEPFRSSGFSVMLVKCSIGVEANLSSSETIAYRGLHKRGPSSAKTVARAQGISQILPK